MAPSAEAVYFPALDKCLNGEHFLVSWKAAYTALCDTAAEDNTSLERFLSDEATIQLLVQALAPFPEPNEKTKAAFSTRTAPIHVQPSSNGNYDIELLKQDATWLSKEVHIDEMSALRVVMLEWQQRPSAQLLSEWSEEEKLSVQAATASAGFGASTIRNPEETTGLTSTEFNKEAPRHERLLKLFWSERAHVLRVSETLVGFAQPADQQPVSAVSIGKSAMTRSWTKDVGRNVWDEQRKPGSGKNFFIQCVDALDARLQTLGDSNKWPTSVKDDDTLLLAFIQSLFTEMTLVLRLALMHAASMAEVPDAASVRSWFDLMDSTSFFSIMPAVSVDQDYNA